MTFESLKNQFLIAMPGLHDPYFYHSVVYICEHNEEGAMGLIINQPLLMHMQQVFETLGIHSKHRDINNLPVLKGGPVQEERGFVIHPTEKRQRWQTSFSPAPDITVTLSNDIVNAIASGKGPENPLIILGYSSWGSGQLEQELAQNSWLNIAASADILFNTPLEKRWEKAAACLGVNFTYMSDQIGHA